MFDLDILVLITWEKYLITHSSAMSFDFLGRVTKVKNIQSPSEMPNLIKMFVYFLPLFAA